MARHASRGRLFQTRYRGESTTPARWSGATPRIVVPRPPRGDHPGGSVSLPRSRSGSRPPADTHPGEATPPPGIFPQPLPGSRRGRHPDPRRRPPGVGHPRPATPRLIDQLAEQPDPAPEKPVRDGALDVRQVPLRTSATPQFRQKPKEEQAHYRVERLKALEAPDAEVPLPDRLKVHEVILDLWRPTTRSPGYLLRIIATVPLIRPVAGAEADLQGGRGEERHRGVRRDRGPVRRRVCAAAATARSAARRSRTWSAGRGGTSAGSGVQLPATYADIACDSSSATPDDTNWRNTWVVNHIFFHESKKYGRSNFRFGYRDDPTPAHLKHRALRATCGSAAPGRCSRCWSGRSPTPCATSPPPALKTDFRAVLRDIEPGWVVRLVGGAEPGDPRLRGVAVAERAEVRAGRVPHAGLHDAVLRLFDSPADAAREYAAELRPHPRPRPAGVANWSGWRTTTTTPCASSPATCSARTTRGRASASTRGASCSKREHGHKFAADVITKHFGAKELTPEWFQGRLLSPSEQAFDFATETAAEGPPTGGARPGVLPRRAARGSTRRTTGTQRVVDYAVGELAKFDLNALDPDCLRWLALFPGGWRHVVRLGEAGQAEGRRRSGMDF